MPQVALDRIDGSSITERYGAIQSLSRRAKVIFSKEEQAELQADDRHLLVVRALDALPQPFSFFFDPLNDPLYQKCRHLVLVERSAAPLGDETDNRTVIADLKYEHLLNGPHQNLDPSVDILTQNFFCLFGKGRCSVQEKPTNFFYPNGDNTKTRTQILVGHTFPKEHSGIAGQVLDPINLPRTIIQGGEISIPFPHGSYEITGYKRTNDPWGVCRSIVRHINSDVWLGELPFHWLCNDADFEVAIPANPGQPGIYKFKFQFEMNFDSWNPTVVFHDQRTGSPPANVVKATTEEVIDGILVKNRIAHTETGEYMPAGHWQVPALPRLDFNTFFGRPPEGEWPSQLPRLTPP